MRRLPLISIAFVLLFGIPSISKAQEAGTWDLGLLTSAPRLSLVPLVGYFIQDDLEILVSIAYAETELDNKSSGTKVITRDFLIDLNGLYNFSVKDNVKFFILAGIGFLKGDIEITGFPDSDIDQVTFNIGAGLRFYAKPNVAVNILLVRSIGDEDINPGNINNDLKAVALSLGYSFFF